MVRPIQALKIAEKLLVNRQTVNPVDIADIDFLTAVEKYGYSDRGDKINLYNWHKEYYALLGNMDVAITYATGCAQVGKSAANYLLVCYLISQGYNTIWAYDQERNLNRCVPLQFRPVIEQWLNELDIKIPKTKSQSNTLFQLNQGSAIFTYTSTTKTTNNSGKGAAAGSSVVSVTADILFLEERSQHLPGSDAPLYRRLDAGKIPTHPVRQLGTPGNGNGIESEIDRANHYFYPACICPNCSEEIILNPKGTLLKARIEKTAKGDEIKKYLSETGKPLTWFCHDEKNSIDTAYFACPHCTEEIPQETRVFESYFTCLYTGIKLKDFLTTPIDATKQLRVGINLSPLLRQSQFNLASDIIRSGLDTSNPADWQQQRLGLPSEASTTALTLEILKRAIKANSDFNRKPDLILCGIDQGRSAHWMVVVEYYLPKPKYGEHLTKYQINDRTYRNVIFGGEIMASAIPERLELFGVDYGIIDNEPDIASASRLSSYTCLELADQKSGALKDFEKSEAKDGGIIYPCWKIHNERFLRQILTNFTLKDEFDEPITRLPDSWDKWITNNSDISPLRHLMSPRYNPENGKWERTDHIDDLYYAFMFCEVAFSIKINKPRGMWGLI